VINLHEKKTRKDQKNNQNSTACNSVSVESQNSSLTHLSSSFHDKKIVKSGREQVINYPEKLCI
jgi:hypothetical protein